MSINPLLTNFGPNASLYAPASGGGGGGGSNTPNPVFSTVTFPQDGGINMSGLFQINDGATGALNDYYFRTAADANTIVGGFNPGGQANTIEINNPGSGSSLIKMGATDAGIGVLASVNPSTVLPSSLYIVADTVTIPYNLNVSSVNGAAPGGGGGGPTVSTFTDLTVAAGSVAAGGTLRMFGDDTNLYSFSVQDSNAAPVASFKLGTVGGRNQFAADVGEITSFYTSSIVGTTGQISLNPSGTEQIRIGGLGAPGDITINTVGGGNIILNGPVQATTTVNATAQTVTISTLVASTINGGTPYTTANPPPASVAPSLVGYNWLPQQQTIYSGVGPLIQYSTITPSPVFSSINGFTLSGSLTCFLKFEGAGNTNPVRNCAQNSNASFGLYMILDGNTIPLTSLSFTTTNNASPAGQYNSVAPSYNGLANYGAFLVQPTYNFNSPTASPGVEFTYTAFGKHTFQLFAWTDIFMNSGDPGASYNMVLRFPASGDFSGQGMLVQTF